MDIWATKHKIVTVEPCTDCGGTSAQVNEFGMIRMCPECADSPQKFFNKYGVDNAEAPSFYMDEEKGVIAAIDRSKDYIILPDGEAIERLII